MTQESPQIAPPEKGQESQERPKKILIIDNDDALIYMTGEYFSDNPMVSAVLCHSVIEAMAAISSISPDVLFLDHNLNGENGEGLEVAAKTKKILPNITIYSTTSIDSDELRSQYERLGVTHVPKSEIMKKAAKILEG